MRTARRLIFTPRLKPSQFHPSKAMGRKEEAANVNHTGTKERYLPHEIEHPTTEPCTVPDSLCPRNDARQLVRIPGLMYYKHFLSEELHETLCSIIDSQPWDHIIARRQQFYGEVYYHTRHNHKGLQPAMTETSPTHQRLDIDLLRPHLEACRQFFPNESFPSQILVNEYRNRLGIASHFEDFDAFGETILTISLLQPIYMTLKKPLYRTNDCHEYHDIQKIYLAPKSLLVMSNTARFDYRHGISKYKWIDGDLERDDSYRRISITLRHLKQTRRSVPDNVPDDSDGWRYQHASKACASTTRES